MTLSTTAITVRYGALVAVDHVDFSVQTGSIHGVIGPNGAGKSTFIDALSGRLRPTTGRIELDGEDMTRRPPVWRRRRGIARSFQRTSVFPSLTVGQQLELVASRTKEPDLDEVVDALGLRTHLASPCEVISYGDQRRVDVALAMLGRPQVLLLDEPAAGLSSDDTEALVDHVRQLAQHRRISVVLVDHDVDAVFRACDEVTVLDLGAVIARGTPAEIRANRRVIDAYLGTRGQVTT
ncbi:MAG: ABC transporter ATP-binding protein [Ilumatobacteraceae bacterium]